ncbi:unnamed protein product [Mytilus edulis]|uniref:C-type lectin domain-containing protein n=1 Tax=Mytilus edulis TaxID=6550 RepID=A0A8S3VI84_MYTED|nr:unnamed protein product [Mytilus edulis]
MTWYEGYDYCVGANKRLVYVMSDFSQLETERLLYLKEVSASLNVGELSFWTIHKVNNQTPKGERFYTESPVENFMYDYSFPLCVYHVYERYNNRLGWEADNCLGKKQYVMCSNRVSSVYLYDDTQEGKVRNRRKSRPATIRQKSPRDGADEEVSVGRTTIQANTGETSLTDLPSLVTSDETVSAERTTTPANNGETSSTELSSIVTSDETVSGERTTTPANNGETSSTDLSTLVTSEENVSIGRTATTANNRETSLADLSLLVTPDKNVSDGRKVSRAGNGEKTLGGQVHTTAGAVIGIMSSFVIIYNAAPLLKGIFKRVPKTADGEIRQGEVEDQVADTIAIAMSGIDDRILLSRRIDKWSVPPISHSDVVS